MLGTDWVGLARELDISDSDINIIKSQYPDNAPQQAIVMLRLWMQTSGNKANGNTLEKGLRKIGRDDIVNQCIFNVELVTDDIERAMAKAHLDQSGFEAFREELGPSRDATLNRDISLDVSYDEQDMMKEAESAEEEEENQRTYQDKTSREQRAADMSPTYETEEKKYAGEEKIVAEEKVTKEVKDDGSTIIATTTTTTTTVVQEPDLDSKKETVIPEKVQKEIIEDQLIPVVIVKDETPTLVVIEDKTPATVVIEDKTPTTVITVEKVEEKMADKVEEKVVEEKLEEKPIYDIEKHVEVVDKVQELKARLKEKAPEAPPPSQSPEDSKGETTTTTELTECPDGTTTSSTTTTERRSFTTTDDGTVQEHIVIEKRTTSSVVDGVTTEEDKSDILQRLGEELGKLDEKLEEKFKEKRKAEEPEVTQEEVRETSVVATRRDGQAQQPTSQVVVEHGPTSISTTTTTTTTKTSSISPTPEGFTQTSVEKSQMSSTRGTADVTTAGTTVTTVQHVGDTVMQTGQGTHEAAQIAEQQPTTLSQDQAEGNVYSQQDVQLVPSIMLESHQKVENSGIESELEKGVSRESEENAESELDNFSEGLSLTGNKAVEEHNNIYNLDETSEAESSLSPIDNTKNEEHIDSTQNDFESVVVRRGASRTGPRPTTFPLCLLQPDVVSSSPEAQQYFRQQQEVLEEMGRQGHLQMDVTDLRDLTSPESLAASNELEESELDILNHAAKHNRRKLVKSSSSYENLYDKADLQAAESQNTPSTLQLASSLGDPFTTKTNLPSEMCSSFENLYMKVKEADTKIVREADLLATEILEEAVQEAAVQEGQMFPVSQNITVSSASLDNEPTLTVVTTSGLDGCQHSRSKESGSADVVQPDSGAGARQAPGLEVEEMSNIMESYTSDGSDLITTTYTTTSIDPDPITSTQTTRIIRRTQIEKDGEVKEDAYEEY